MSQRFYRKTNHACRVCFGRVFAYVDEHGAHWVECADCGLTKRSQKPEAICACGYKVREPGRAVKNWKNAGFRCRPNPNVTPEVPAQIIVVHEGEHGGSS